VVDINIAQHVIKCCHSHKSNSFVNASSHHTQSIGQQSNGKSKGKNSSILLWHLSTTEHYKTPQVTEDYIKSKYFEFLKFN